MVSSIAPFKTLRNVGSGFSDLVLIPASQYKKDGNIVRRGRSAATLPRHRAWSFFSLGSDRPTERLSPLVPFGIDRLRGVKAGLSSFASKIGSEASALISGIASGTQDVLIAALEKTSSTGPAPARHASRGHLLSVNQRSKSLEFCSLVIERNVAVATGLVAHCAL